MLSRSVCLGQTYLLSQLTSTRGWFSIEGGKVNTGGAEQPKMDAPTEVQPRQIVEVMQPSLRRNGSSSSTMLIFRMFFLASKNNKKSSNTLIAKPNRSTLWSRRTKKRLNYWKNNELLWSIKYSLKDSILMKMLAVTNLCNRNKIAVWNVSINSF